jgi:S1-C subfamily serine protease
MRNALIIAALAVLLVHAQVWETRAEVSSDTIAQGIPRAVLLQLLVRSGDGLRVFSSCSGSIVSPTGHILTASHCVRAIGDNAQIGFRKGELYNPEGKTAVGFNLPDQERPIIKVVATYVADDPTADIALLKVSALLGRGEPAPLPPDLRFPFLRLGDSNLVRHGDPVALIGFPAAGEDTVSVNQGFVSGFIVDDQNRRLRLKYDAVGGGGASGGPVINGRGEQIAIHTGGFPAGGVYQLRGTLTNRIPTAWLQSIQSVAADARTVAAGTLVFQGRIVDAYTAAGLAGAALYLLKPGTAHRTATGTDVVARGLADANGNFQTSPPVRRGAVYPALVLAAGYQQVEGTIQTAPQGADVEVLRPIQLVKQ